MQALAMSDQPAFRIGVLSGRGRLVLSPGRLVPLALLPVQATCFHTSLFVKIVRIIGASLPGPSCVVSAVFFWYQASTPRRT